MRLSRVHLSDRSTGRMSTMSFKWLSMFLITTLGWTQQASGNHHSYHHMPRVGRFWGIVARGGSITATKTTDAYEMLAATIQSQVKSERTGEVRTIERIVQAFKTLAASQQYFKGLDGAAHEAYQRTHADADSIDLSVEGRARRSAIRAGVAADGLFACELCELVSDDSLMVEGRQVLVNNTGEIKLGKDIFLNVLVLYEPEYTGGAGVEHGGIEQDQVAQPANGRLLVILGDTAAERLDQTFRLLARAPVHVRLGHGRAGEAASVQPALYKAAGSVLQILEPLAREYNTSAIHFTGRSLAGGVACLSACILDGRLPLPGEKKRQRGSQDLAKDDEYDDDDTNRTEVIPLQGLGKGRTSAVTLGGPPCLSANVQADFVKSILYGDDVVARSSKESIDRFLSRTRSALKKAGLLGRQVSRVTDTISLATANLKSHAHGSEGEEARLTVSGQAFLIRPRRLGEQCSIHEIGSQLKGGREALRAAVLWQLNDILLSKSMWKHHQLTSYIHGIDRIHLRGLDDDDQEEQEE